jgi:hypothetical protein
MYQTFKYFCFFYIAFLTSCKEKKTNTIDVEIINKLFIESSFKYIKSNIDEFNFEYVNDTVYTNNSNKHIDDALKPLLSKYHSIDSINTNLETKQYVKSLLLAEWIYANFNFQFLGPKLGLTDTMPSVIDFRSSNPDLCYQAGNNNEMAVWCGDRSNLFTRLLDSLLHLKADVISINQIHSFPIVTIGAKKYIIDPFDPFILFNHNQTEIIDYDFYKINHDSINLCAKRTKGTFGISGELISKRLYRMMQNIYTKKDANIGLLIKNYLKTNLYFLSTFNDTCKSEPFVTKRKVYPVYSKTNAFVIYSPKNALPHEIKRTRLHKYYLGLDCKINR